jgi:bis(5'-adenosyl)-triphosphatase
VRPLFVFGLDPFKQNKNFENPNIINSMAPQFTMTIIRIDGIISISTPPSLRTSSFLFFLLFLSSLVSSVASMTTTTSATSTSASATTTNGDMRFGKFLIPSRHIFYRTPLSAAFVNLRPIVPGHVLVMPKRIVTTMEELSEDEYIDMWKSVRQVQTALRQHYTTDRNTTDKDTGTTTTMAFNVAVQDGRAAGQSVPHVHVHILPRTSGDFERNDDVYDALELWAPREQDVLPEQRTNNIQVPEDVDRVDRTNELMAEEAALYRTILSESSSKL